MSHTPQQLQKLGESLFEEERFEEAETVFKKLVKADSTSIEGWWMLATVSIAMGNYSQAEITSRIVLADLPEQVEIMDLLATALLKQDKFSEAVMVLLDILGSSEEPTPRDADTYQKLGQAYVGLAQEGGGNLQDALDSFQEAHQLQPTSIPTLYGLAHVYSLMNDLESSQKVMATILRLNPDEADHLTGAFKPGVTANDAKGVVRATELFESGDAFYDAGKFQEAVRSFQQAIILKPDYYSARGMLASSLVRLKNYEEAEEAYLQLIALRPDDLQALHGLVVALNPQRKYDEIIGVSKTIIGYNPNDAKAYGHICLACIMASNRGENRLSEALASAQKAHALAPNESDYIFRLGWVYALMGDTDSAWEQLDILHERDSEQALALAEVINKKQNESATQQVEVVPVAPESAASKDGLKGLFRIFGKK